MAWAARADGSRSPMGSSADVGLTRIVASHGKLNVIRVAQPLSSSATIGDVQPVEAIASDSDATFSMLTSAAHGGMVSPPKTGKNTGSRESAFWNRLSVIAGTLGRVGGASWAVVPLSPLHSAKPAAHSTPTVRKEPNRCTTLLRPASP